MRALLGFTSEAHWLRYARGSVARLFRYLPELFGSNKRLLEVSTLFGSVIRSYRPMPHCGPMTCQWSIPRRSSAVDRSRRCGARI
ncbi:hypothetical protein AXA44_42910 [Rhodococcus sp. SC4]|nr:hypothetical protein AXA44_42910 [Rhodococcus sp. SC4]